MDTCSTKLLFITKFRFLRYRQAKDDEMSIHVVLDNFNRYQNTKRLLSMKICYW